MERKEFLKMIGAGFGASFLAGCSNVLKPKVYTNLTPNNFFSSAADFNNAVIALYNPFTSNWGTQDQGLAQWYAALYNADIKTYLMRSEVTTDEMHSPWDANLINFTFGPATYQVGNGSAPTYAKISYVAKATDVINNISKSTANVPASVKNEYLAEAKCLRAWLMFVLYDFFGPLDVKLDPSTLYDIKVTPRLSQSDYISAIEKDLNDALPNLVDKYNNDNANWGRVSKGTARMLLLRLYMHEKQWAKAESVAKDIMSMGFSLMNNYADVFNVSKNDEIIYAIPADLSSPNYYMQEVLPSDFAKTGNVERGPGWYGEWMPWDFYDKYDSNDSRLSTVFGSYVNQSGKTMDKSAGMPGAIPLKYTAIQGDGPGYAIDWVVFRYAEVLLSLAEAINEQRGPGDALQYVNQVRQRANVTPFSSSMSQAQLRTALLDERGRELYAEGVRRQDLIRAGKFISLAQSRGASAKSYQTLFPIPQDVIVQGNGIIKQNPGYSS